MFATYEGLRFPIQFGDDSVIWRAVEVTLNTPWLLATLSYDHQALRTFLLDGPDDLLQFIQISDIGNLAAVRLVLPPNVSATRDWSFVPICRIERELRSKDGGQPRVVLVSSNGLRYGGFPISEMSLEEADLVAVKELSTEAI